MFTKYLDPKNDYAFKRIFGQEKNKDILIHFLNAVVNFKEGLPVVDITYLKPVQDPEISSQKTSIVDILCKDEKGNQYVVEMQVAREKGFVKRAQYYAAKAYCNQADSGSEYQDLKEVIFIAITQFEMFPDKEDYKSDHIILDKKTKEHDLKDFSFTFLELPKFNKRNTNDLDDIIEKWMYFFKYAEDTDPSTILKLSHDYGILQSAYKELDRAYWTKDEYSTYEDALKKMKDLKAAYDQKYDDGIAKGMELGLEEGMMKGMTKGMKLGERKAKLETAKALQHMGVTLELIAQATGLTLEDLNDLR
ncbi:MAG: hypothetical protein HEEMFOPI_01612 [Holosporales bacterium]